MGKIGVTMSANRADAQVSEHFGKAEWIMVTDEAGGSPTFIQNDAQNGRGVAEIALQQGCTEMLFAGIGGGAIARLDASGIRGWALPKGVSGQEALEQFRRKVLPQAHGAVGHENGGGGCCCSGKGHSGASSCCGR